MPPPVERVPERGSAAPIGPHIVAGGVNFSLYSRQATSVDLLLFDAVDDATPRRTIGLDATRNRTGDYWHVFVTGVGHGQHYGFHVGGPWQPADGLVFDERLVLLDPYARGVAVPPGYSRAANASGGHAVSTAGAMKSVVVDLARYDWEGDAPLQRPFRDTIIYEAHVRGFTAHPSSGLKPARRGTYAGFIEKIPYLVDLGITAVELLPVFAFDRLAAPDGLTNYWGYQPVGFFAPHAAHATDPNPIAAADEFRDLVKALHRAGIEVILDVVYNHTAEGGPSGPTFSFRGLGNDDYYLLADDRSQYMDYTGTGNTLETGNAVVRRLVLDSLRFWVQEMHVDGFRFDLAAVLSRGRDGRPSDDPAVLHSIDTDPVLAGTKLIAEPWDAGGLYQVGSFVGERWVEWNGRFRDDVRSFVKSDPGMAGAIVQRILASPDLYGHRNRDAQESINFVTCHDGFTLADVVSYNAKHNEANGEGNRDGNDANLSWNCGVEGPTDDPAVESLRRRQIRNFLAMELLAFGVPMLQMGDEVRRTQRGNNNAYCQDNAVSWLDWADVEHPGDTLAFVRGLTRLRRRLQTLFAVPDDLSLLDMLQWADITVGGVRYGEPDMAADSHAVALTFAGRPGWLHVMLNAYWEPLEFELPPPDERRPHRGWRRILDTTLEPPDDLMPDYPSAPLMEGASYRVGPRSVVVLAGQARDAPA